MLGKYKRSYKNPPKNKNENYILKMMKIGLVIILVK